MLNVARYNFTFCQLSRLCRKKWKAICMAHPNPPRPGGGWRKGSLHIQIAFQVQPIQPYSIRLCCKRIKQFLTIKRCFCNQTIDYNVLSECYLCKPYQIELKNPLKIKHNSKRYVSVNFLDRRYF